MGLEKGLPGCSKYALNQYPICGAVSPIAMIHKSKKEDGNGSTPLTIDQSELLANFLLSFPMNLGSIGLEVLVPKGGMFLLGDTTVIPLNWKMTLPPNHFGFLMPLNYQTNKRVTVQARVTDHNY